MSLLRYLVVVAAALITGAPAMSNVPSPAPTPQQVMVSRGAYPFANSRIVGTECGAKGTFPLEVGTCGAKKRLRHEDPEH